MPSSFSTSRIVDVFVSSANNINAPTARCNWRWWPWKHEHVLLISLPEETELMVCTMNGFEVQDLETSPWLQYLAEHTSEDWSWTRE